MLATMHFARTAERMEILKRFMIVAEASFAGSDREWGLQKIMLVATPG